MSDAGKNSVITYTILMINTFGSDAKFFTRRISEASISCPSSKSTLWAVVRTYDMTREHDLNNILDSCH